MDIYIAKDGQPIGPYRPNEIQARLEDSTFDGTELAWHEGRADWTAIREILNHLPTQKKQPVTIPARNPSDDTQVPREQSRKESNTQKKMAVVSPS